MPKLWRFHDCTNPQYGINSLNNALEKGGLIQDDADLISEYVEESRAVRSISDARALKIIYDLVAWRRFLSVPYRTANITEIHRAINALNVGTSIRGTPFAQNTKHDYVKILKTFCTWLIDQGYSDLPATKIQKIRAPRVNTQTVDPADILTQQEIVDLIAACSTIRDRAIIATLYETGARISEIARLAWRDIHFDDYGASVTIHDEKTGRSRHSRAIASIEYLTAWRNTYPGDPSGSAGVFISSRDGQPMKYRALAQMISRSSKRAGIRKRVHPHLFRHSRITHLIQQNYQESVIKKTMWGNLNTAQFQTYANLCNTDIDEEFLEKAGIKKKQIKEDNKLSPQQCDTCFAVNGPANDYCRKCGAPLSEEARQKQSLTIDTTLQGMAVDPRFAAIEGKMEDMIRQIEEMSQEYKIK